MSYLRFYSPPHEQQSTSASAKNVHFAPVQSRRKTAASQRCQMAVPARVPAAHIPLSSLFRNSNNFSRCKVLKNSSLFLASAALHIFRDSDRIPQRFRALLLAICFSPLGVELKNYKYSSQKLWYRAAGLSGHWRIFREAWSKVLSTVRISSFRSQFLQLALRKIRSAASADISTLPLPKSRLLFLPPL